MNYKDTLLMPKTEFEMKGNLPKKEPVIQEKWEELDLFELLMKEREGNKSFVLHDGPPYANGDIHIGHGLNKVIKDIVNRSKSLQGYYTPYIPGWDTHGLPIETAISKTGVDRKKMSVAEFRNLCEQYAYKQIEIQKKGFKRLGSIGDYKNPYITLTPDFEAEQIKVFGKMAMDGLIYQGFKPVYWSPSSETAMAEGEIEYHEKPDTSVYVKFNMVDGKDIFSDDVSFMCWTTMPWTITTTVGVAVGPNFEYGLYQTNHGKLVFAKELENDIVEKTGLEVELLQSFKGSEFENIKLSNPYSEYVCLVVLGDHVTIDDGSGCVTVAPGHGAEDFAVGEEYGLELLIACDELGRMRPETGEEIAGVYWEKANRIIIDSIKEKNRLVAEYDLVHRYPYDWRTKKPLIFMAALQWFASIEKSRDKILNEIENNIKWTPSWGRTRMFNMIKDRGDWCISRQRAWGVPIPILYDENGEPIFNQSIFDFVSDKFREHGSNYWFDSKVEDLLPQSYKDSHDNIDKYTKESDIMDVWFDSGSSHQGCITARGMEYPVDMYLEGSDQYRGWFNSSLIVGTCYTGHSPYREVLSHGFTLDGNGNKMSKSLGNTMEPLKIINQYGADVFRYWVSSTDYQSDVRISDHVLKQNADAYRKVRNTYKFILGNLNNFDDTMLVETTKLEEVDKYMLVKLNKLSRQVIKDYNDYEYSNVYNNINSYIVKELSAFYMDYAKDILYILKEDDLRRRQVQTVLYYCLETINMLISPILVHTAEEVYSYLPKSNKKVSVHLEVINDEIEVANANEIEEKYDLFMKHRDDILKAIETAREDKIIGKSLEANVRVSFKEGYEFIKDIENLHQLYIVSNVEFIEDKDALDLETAKVKVEKFDGYLCPRCWNIVNEERVINDLCDRCDAVVNH